VVDRTFVENLPLNGRSFQTLIMLTPGVVITPTTLTYQGQFSVNGQRADANYFTVDGASGNFGLTGYFPLVQTACGGLPALSATGGTNSLISVDAMQEFRIQTSSVAPEFGRTPGGQISIVTRSGTNSFHGTVFEYFRNGVLNANNWFADFNRLAKPEERQNDFGGVLGGQIVKDKTFFFFSYEGLRLRQPVTQQTVVPDAASRLQAPAAIQPFLNAYSVPNGPAAGPGMAQFDDSYSNPSSLDDYSIRVDHAVNSKLNLFGRYNYSPSSLDQRAATFTSAALSTTESLSSSVQTMTIGMTELITPLISNETRANYSNDRLGTKFLLDDFGGAVPLPDSVLLPPGFSSNDSAFLFLISGAGEYGQGKSAIDEQRQLNFIDNLSLTRGSHQLKFGVDYRWLAPFSSPFAYRAFVDFSGVTSAPGGALSGLLRLLNRLHFKLIKLERRLSRGLQALASYAFAHSIDIASTDSAAGNLSTPGTIADPGVDRGDSDFDIWHSFTAGVTYDLPAPGSQRALRAMLGGWSLDSFVFARSAPPVDIVGPTSFAAGIALAPRPNVNPGVPFELFGPQYPGGKIFNKAAFSASSAGQQGNS